MAKKKKQDLSVSSESEDDLTQVLQAVDTQLFNNDMFSNDKKKKVIEKAVKKSERYLEEESHFSDVVVPKQVQQHIGKKVSRLINEKIEFTNDKPKLEVEIEPESSGGIKLFKDSKAFISLEEKPELDVIEHNKRSRKNRNEKRKLKDDLTEEEKCQQAAIDPEVIISKEETKHWKSRRKEKLFKYSSISGSSSKIVAREIN